MARVQKMISCTSVLPTSSVPTRSALPKDQAAQHGPAAIARSNMNAKAPQPGKAAVWPNGQPRLAQLWYVPSARHDKPTEGYSPVVNVMERPHAKRQLVAGEDSSAAGRFMRSAGNNDPLRDAISLPSC